MVLALWRTLAKDCTNRPRYASLPLKIFSRRGFETEPADCISVIKTYVGCLSTFFSQQLLDCKLMIYEKRWKLLIHFLYKLKFELCKLISTKSCKVLVLFNSVSISWAHLVLELTFQLWIASWDRLLIFLWIIVVCLSVSSFHLLFGKPHLKPGFAFYYV